LSARQQGNAARVARDDATPAASRETSSLASATGTDSCTRHGQPSAVPPAALPEAPASKSGQAAPVEPECAAGAARPWPSVKQPTVRTDRPRTPTPSAIRPWTPRHGGLQRDKATHGGTEKKRPASSENSQPAGRFRRWWQVLGSNQRRLSRRFYRPLPLATRATCRAPPVLVAQRRIAQDATRR
jgi:hypothetical protein